MEGLKILLKVVIIGIIINTSDTTKKDTIIDNTILSFEKLDSIQKINKQYVHELDSLLNKLK